MQGFSALNFSKMPAERALFTAATGFDEAAMALSGARFTMRLVLNVLTFPPECFFPSSTVTHPNTAGSTTTAASSTPIDSHNMT